MYLNIAQNIGFYSTLTTGWAGVVGNGFFQFRVNPSSRDLPEFENNLPIFPATLAAFPCSKFGGFVILFSYIVDFFSDVKRVQYRTRIRVTSFPLLFYYFCS